MVPNTSTFLQGRLAAEAQFLLEEQKLKIEMSLINRAGTRTSTDSKTEGQNVESM
jgi:hypothetical protein